VPVRHAQPDPTPRTHLVAVLMLLLPASAVGGGKYTKNLSHGTDDTYDVDVNEFGDMVGFVSKATNLRAPNPAARPRSTPSAGRAATRASPASARAASRRAPRRRRPVGRLHLDRDRPCPRRQRRHGQPDAFLRDLDTKQTYMVSH
jgi:hypothetical protein